MCIQFRVLGPTVIHRCMFDGQFNFMFGDLHLFHGLLISINIGSSQCVLYTLECPYHVTLMSSAAVESFVTPWSLWATVVQSVHTSRLHISQ